MTAPRCDDTRERGGRHRLTAPRRRLTLALITVVALGAEPSLAADASEPPHGAIIPESLPGGPPLGDALRRSLAKALVERGEGYVPRTKNRHADGSPIYTNRLLLETSPYLLQHAHNPVNWYPWGEAAFAEARRLDRPILVSIGYSTCHWCHVMEEETFDDPDMVRFLNEHFIAIKVDREARPDIDSIYMAAIHAMNQHGGWPLNMWVTPRGVPFYGGTYFPPKDGRGRPGFGAVLRRIHEQYTENRASIDKDAERIRSAIVRQLAGSTAIESRVPDRGTLMRAKQSYARSADRTWGGLGSRTKFPSSLPIVLLLRYHRLTGDDDALELATLTLDKMAAGGIHDHLGGGFHRYSTEQRWLIPHFEKMLYDNALLANGYLEAAQATGRVDYRQLARETLDYVAREMTAPGGAFYSATDADSANEQGEQEEGWFFTWTPAEIEAALPADQARAVIAYYGVTEKGTYEGRNILHSWREPQDVAKELGITAAALEQQLGLARAELYRTRALRSAPLRDDKILVAWNGLMISAFARAGFTLDDADYTARASRAARYILDHMRRGERLQRISLDGQASGPAFLEDYAFLIAALIDVYEADPSPRWLREAIRLQHVLDQHYADALGGGYFRTADDGEQLLAREKPSRDGALPGGNSVSARNLLRLAEITGDDQYLDAASMLFSAFHDSLTEQPTRLAEMLLAVDYSLESTKEIVIVAPEHGAAPDEMLDRLRSQYLPNRVLLVVREGDDLAAHAALAPLVKGKTARRGRVTAYVCENRVCAYPTSEPDEFERQLRQ
jgi:uncharacterized protein YyaL (SSP411 family)